MTRLSLLVTAILLVACSGNPVQTQYYLLRTDSAAATRQLAPSSQVAMGTVIIAPYVDQSGLVMELSPGEIHPARSHQWAEPMPEAVRGLLSTEISDQLGVDIFPGELANADTFIDVRINQLHGTADGNARLVAYWALRRGGEVVESYYFEENRPLSEDGYAALARACEALLVELADNIAASVESLAEVAH